jgi:DNA-binding response OmpR family regulator
MTSIRVLIAEDENNLRKLITMYLKNSGYTVYDTEDGEKALDVFYDTPIDIAILDISMTKIDGWEVLKEIRKTSNIPIILLTAKREEIDRIHGFELGTDDYVTKPFSPKELVMRVKALLKRSGKLSQNNIIELNNINIDIEKKSVKTKTNDDISLSAREFDLLVYFADNLGIVLTRDNLFERIWGYDNDTDTRTLDTTIKRLRKKLGEYGSCIKTIRGTGYLFEVSNEKNSI